MKALSNVSKSALMAALITGICAGGVQQSLAAEVQSYTLDEMVVTATRTEKAVVDTPANVQVITGKEIKEGGYQSVFEAVKNFSQANVHTYQEDGGDYGGMMSRIRVRGIDDATLVLINGNPANYMNHASLNSIPMDQIEKIEVVKGANSVLYGPQAMGGVINIITKHPGQDDKVSGNVYGSYGNRKNEAGTSIQTEFVNIGYKKTWNRDFNDAVMPGTTGRGTAFDIIDKSSDQLYLDANVAKDLTFSYGRTHNESKFKAGKWVNFSPVLDKLTAYQSTFDNYSLAYNSDNGWKGVLGYNSVRMDSRPDKTYPSVGSYSNYDGYSMNADLQKTFLSNDDKNALTVGANFNREFMQQDGAKHNENTRDAYSLYQSYDFHTSDKMEFIIGLREYYVDKTQYQDSDFQLLPQVQGIYKATEKSNYYFNVGKSFQMPSISSSFYYSDNSVINSDLKPQSGWSYEAGYKYDDGKTSVSADVFYMKVKDKFYWDKDEEDRNIMRNRDQWKNTGVELNYKQTFDDQLSGSFGITYQNPQGYSNGKWVQDAAKVIMNMGATYNRDKFTVDSRLFTYLKREPAYYNYTHTSSKNPDHNLKNLVDLTMTLTYKPTNNDTLRLVGKNLFGREDALNNYEYMTMPRNYVFTYERSF